MFQSLLSNWNFMRVLRLVLSVIIIAQAVSVNDTAMSIAGVLLLGLTLANIGCCGANGCAAPTYKKPEDKKEETISYEEIH